MFRSLRVKIVLIMFLVTSFVFGLLSYYTFNKLNNLPPIILKQYQEIADARANEFSQELKGLEYQIEMIALSNVIISMDMNEIKPYLISISKQDYFDSFTISDLDGIAWTTGNRIIDISEQQQFQDIIINNEDKSTSNPFFSPYIKHEYPIITIAHAIKQDNKTVGLINGVVSTRFINTIIHNISLKNSGYGWLVDNQGNVIAHPDKDITIFDSISTITSLSEFDFLSNKNGSFSFVDKQDNQMLGIHSTIEHSNGWQLILTIDEELAYNEVTSVISAISIGLTVALLILFLFVLWFSYRSTQPILNLKETFEKATHGNLNVEADASADDEIGDAARSFNTMLSQIKHLTFVDPVTGLNNYFSFFNEIQHMDQKLVHQQDSIYIVIISIDNFKKINTFYGYDFGNKVLRKLAETITNELEKSEIISRYFSDEMILSLQGKDEAQIQTKIEKIIAHCEKSMTISNVQIKVELSCGCSLLDSLSNLENVVREATLAKFKAKTASTGKIVFYNQSIFADVQYKQQLEETLNNAISNNELALVYQPIYDTLQQKIIGYEALLRWNHPLYSQTPISTVIDIAETNGMIIQIGEWVFKTAVSKLRSLHKTDSSLFMSINVSPIQLISDTFLGFIQETIVQAKVPAEKVTIEITETSSMMDVLDKKILLAQIKEMGLYVSIDDFGTGYSSLNYLSQLPIDTIKIDKQFIQRINTDKYSHTLISSIIAIAKTLKLSVIAEGVETQQELTLLQELGCTIIQGYFISKPIPLEED